MADSENESRESFDPAELAALAGLHAVPQLELARWERDLAADENAEAEYRRELVAVREAMGVVSEATAVAPPTDVRARLLGRLETEPPAQQTTEPAGSTDGRSDGPGRGSGRLRFLAAAAAVAIAVGAAGWVIGVRSGDDGATPSSAIDQVLAADDVRASSGAVATGQATLTFSTDADTGVLVMNDVPPPADGTVYQMWLVGPSGARSAGTMGPTDVAPSTTAVITGLGDAQSLAFTVEQGGPAAEMSGVPVAELPLR